MKFDPPYLREGPESGRVYVITHGEIDGEKITSTQKYDVTDQFDRLALSRLARARQTPPPDPVGEVTVREVQ